MGRARTRMIFGLSERFQCVLVAGKFDVHYAPEVIFDWGFFDRPLQHGSPE